MKLQFPHPRRQSDGHALLLVMSLAAVCLLMVAATMNRTAQDAALNARNNQYQASLYAAEAATEQVVARVKQDFMSGDLTWVTNSLYAGTYQKSVPTSLTGHDSYWDSFQFSDGQGHNGSNYVACYFTEGWSALRSQYAGMSGWTNHLYIISNAKQTPSLYNITAAVEQDIEMDLIPVFQYAIFYNGLLEFTWCAPMTVNGRTHANGSIYTGSAWQLTFNSLVDTTGTISSPAWDGHATSEYSVSTTYNGTYKTNSTFLSLPIGTTNSADAVREIINMPPPGGDTNSALAAQRFYNKAGVVLLVSNTSITAIIKSSSGDLSPIKTNITYNPVNTSLSNYVSISNYFPFINLTNLWPAASNPLPIIDQREGATLRLTDIDVSKLKTWLVTNSLVNTKFPNTGGVYPSNTNAPNIMYVADNRTYGAGYLTAVRLKNATIIPTNLFSFTGSNIASGFTFATPNPLYIQGHYNIPNGGAYYTGSPATNTTAAGTYPASLVSDALTVLSTAWVDSKGTNGADTSSPRPNAGSTTISAAILTGVVNSTGSGSTVFSGGVHNLPRLLEDWSSGSAVLTMNTSIVNLFNSVRATNSFLNPPAYYDAPTRNFSFDPNFLLYYKQPPGTPMLSYVIRSKWSALAPGTTNYAGY